MKDLLFNLGLRRKMQVMNLLICGGVLLVAISALFVFEVLNFRANFQRETATLAEAIAKSSKEAVMFKQEDWLGEVINSLQGTRTVVAASLVADNEVLAHVGLPETDSTRAQFPPPGQSRFEGRQLLTTQPIILNGETVGMLYLRSEYWGIFLKLLEFYGLVVGGVILVSAGLWALFSAWLRRTISDPILSLAHTAQVVGEQKDYSVRAVIEKRGDELGQLTHSFNDMLGRIQSQDAALSLSQQKMEALINSIDGIVWERALDTFQFTFVSRQCEALLGYVPQVWLSEADFWANKLHPQDAATAIETGHELAAQGRPYSFEYRMLAADGRAVWIRESGMALVENGKPAVLRGILLDITRQKHDAEQLDKLNRRLMETSRQAGMADVATGVLHNVGNVLNSVSVAATVVGDRLRHSKLPNLRKAAAMLREQNGHLVDFLTHDPKGKVLPEYIGTVTDQLAEEQTKLAAKMETLAQHVEHIKEIVAMQQSYAKVSGAYESLAPVDLVEDALRINATAFDRHGIELVRDFAPKLPAVVVDRHKVLQILINLMRNAKHAMEESHGPRRMVIRVSQSSPEAVQVSVRDSGVGIPAENLTRIFNHGFTTKKDGHGFGLHSGANAAKEMGGSLKGFSDGPGKGAEFVLELPTTTHARQEQRSKAQP